LTLRASSPALALVCAESTKPLNSNDDHDQSQSRDVRRSLVEVMQIGVETMQDVVLVALALTTSLAAMLGDVWPRDRWRIRRRRRADELPWPSKRR
jgi:hypothetical protein